MNQRSFKRRVASLLGVGWLLLCQLCFAEPAPTTPAPDRVTSQVLFERGRALFIEQRYAEACPLFEESHRLAPGIGVLLHLGACMEKSGKTASAWAAFQEAADRARAEGDKEREKIAQVRATELRRNLSYLTLRLRNADGEPVTASSNVPSGLDLRRDGQTIPLAILGLEVPVDPGEHSVVVGAPDLQETKKTVTLAVGEHASLELDLVARSVEVNPKSEPATLPAIAPPRATTVRLVPMPRRKEPADPWPTIAWTAAGIGGVGLVTGGVAGLVAYTKMREARTQCEGHPTNDCPTSSTQRQEDAKLPANISTVAVAVGAAGLAFAGGYWLISRSSQTRMTGSILPGTALITMQSRW
jgi:hypothetical protein